MHVSHRIELETNVSPDVGRYEQGGRWRWQGGGGEGGEKDNNVVFLLPPSVQIRSDKQYAEKRLVSRTLAEMIIHLSVFRSCPFAFLDRHPYVRRRISIEDSLWTIISLVYSLSSSLVRASYICCFSLGTVLLALISDRRRIVNNNHLSSESSE